LRQLKESIEGGGETIIEMGRKNNWGKGKKKMEEGGAEKSTAIFLSSQPCDTGKDLEREKKNPQGLGVKKGTGTSGGGGQERKRDWGGPRCDKNTGMIRRKIGGILHNNFSIGRRFQSEGRRGRKRRNTKRRERKEENHRGLISYEGGGKISPVWGIYGWSNKGLQ